MRKILTRFFVWCCCFAWCGSGLLWLAGDLRVNAMKEKAGSQIENQYTAIPLNGGEIYRNYCAACHGLNGRGDGPAAAALKTRPPDLTTIVRRSRGTFPSPRIRGTIAGDAAPAAHGSQEMPIWGPMFHVIENDQDLGYVRLQNVTDYLKSIQK